jgi:glycosyltransferase involved in cell wall biosynthesis
VAEKRPTILQIIPELDTGGAELSTIEIAGAVQDAGGRAIVLSEGGRLVQRLRDVGAELEFFAAASKNPVRLLWNAHAIAKIIRREGVDLIHARSRAPAWSAFIAARRTGIPFVTTYHGAYAEKTAIKRLYNSVMARADLVIANSHYTADLIRMRYGTPTSRLRVIYRGLDPESYDPQGVTPDRVAALRQSWGITENQRVVLHAARLTGWKGQTVVIEAARLLNEAKKLQDAVFILAGDAQGRSGYLADLLRRIRTADLEGRVRLVGHVNDIPAALLAAHAAVVASTEPEAFGRAATEAQALGTPVIATDIGAPPETVLSPPRFAPDQATGWLIPPSDPQRLADAVSAALSLSPDARAAMGARARIHVTTKFSLAAMKEQTLRVYDELLGTSLANS